MKEQLISLKTAKLAHKLKFNWKCNALWQNILIEGETNNNIINEKDIYAAPTQSLLQKWLRETYGIDIWIEKYPSDTTYIFQCPLLNNKKIIGYYKTYEKALEIGLYEAVKFIKNEKKSINK